MQRDDALTKAERLQRQGEARRGKAEAEAVNHRNWVPCLVNRKDACVSGRVAFRNGPVSKAMFT